MTSPFLSVVHAKEPESKKLLIRVIGGDIPVLITLLNYRKATWSPVDSMCFYWRVKNSIRHSVCMCVACRSPDHEGR